MRFYGSDVLVIIGLSQDKAAFGAEAPHGERRDLGTFERDLTERLVPLLAKSFARRNVEVGARPDLIDKRFEEMPVGVEEVELNEFATVAHWETPDREPLWP